MIHLFTPGFDTFEIKDAYCLNGELTGVKSKDLDIMFADFHTLIIGPMPNRKVC